MCRSERICSLGRKLSNISTNFSDTFSSQWLERTLDDSAIRRIDIPEIFLLTDALLILLDDVTNGLVVFPAMIRSQIEQEIPFIATENIIMKLVQKDVSRQEAHERVRVLSLETVHAMKMEGSKNNLIERIKRDGFFVRIILTITCVLTNCRFKRSLSWTSLTLCWTLSSSLVGPPRSSRDILGLMGRWPVNWTSIGASLIRQQQPHLPYDLSRFRYRIMGKLVVRWYEDL